jgi:hypothetical protein
MVDLSVGQDVSGNSVFLILRKPKLSSFDLAQLWRPEENRVNLPVADVTLVPALFVHLPVLTADDLYFMTQLSGQYKLPCLDVCHVPD